MTCAKFGIITFYFIIIIICSPNGMTSGSREAGLTLVLTKSGLDYVNKVSGDIINRELLSMTIMNDMRHNFDRGFVQAKNIKIRSFLAPDYSYNLREPDNSVEWSVKGGSIVVQADWMGSVKRLLKFSSEGSMIMKTARLDLTLLARVGENEGRPELDVEKCIARWSVVDLYLRGGVLPFLLNIFKSHIANRLRPVLEGAVCNLVRNFAQNEINAKLRTIPFEIQLTESLFLDYTLASVPKIRKNRAILRHKGEIFQWILDEQGRKISRMIFEQPKSDIGIERLNESLLLGQQRENDKMLSFLISQDVLNTWLHSAHKIGLTILDVSNERYPAIFRYFATDCQDNEICLGNIVDGYATAYRGHNISVTVKTIEGPRINFDKSENGPILSIAGSLEIQSLSSPNILLNTSTNEKLENSTTILSLDMSSDALLTLAINSLENQTKIKAKVEILTLSATSQGDSPLPLLNDPFYMDNLLQTIVKPIFEMELNRLGNGGLQLPIAHGARIIGAQVDIIENHYALLSGDIEYSYEF